MILDSFFLLFSLLYYCVARHICSVSVLLCLGNSVCVFFLFTSLCPREREANQFVSSSLLPSGTVTLQQSPCRHSVSCYLDTGEFRRDHERSLATSTSCPRLLLRLHSLHTPVKPRYPGGPLVRQIDFHQRLLL